MISVMSGYRIELDELDLQASLEQRKEWGKLNTLFDGTAMSVLLQNAYNLPATHKITRCLPDTPVYLPDEDACILLYELEIENMSSGETFRPLLNARAFASHKAFRMYVDQLPPAMAIAPPFANPVAHIPSLSLTVAAFPVDDTMPTISAAMKPETITAVLQQALHDKEIGKTAVELIRYKHRRSCVLRYQPDQGPTIYGKISFHDTDATLVRAIHALQEHVDSYPKEQQFYMPHAYGFYPAQQLTLLSTVPGAAKKIYRLIKDRLGWQLNPKHKTLSLEATLTLCAQAAAIIHSANIPVGDTHTIDTEFAELNSLASAALVVAPSFGHHLQRWLQLLQNYADQTNPLPLAFSHGDFTYKQFLFEGDQVGLIDFDTIGQAEPARDLGHFLAYLRIASFRLQKDASLDAHAIANQLCNHFLAAYLAAANANDSAVRERVLLYEAIALIRIMTHSWQKFKGHRLPYVITALEMILERIDKEVTL